MKASVLRYLVDAGPLVGAFSRNDRWHAWSRNVLVSLGSEVHTSECVFAEAACRLKPYPMGLISLLDALHSGRVRFSPVYPEHAVRCIELIRKFPDRMDVGDASLVILSELNPRARLITTDAADFNLYRRKDGSAVPSILPPNTGGRLQEEAADFLTPRRTSLPVTARKSRRPPVAS
ncbi:MAG TPA: DNA-binding protein [Opitutaceae bacterium]|nr:DNA-binding protein [Opitutaceae bacterium]